MLPAQNNFIPFKTIGEVIEGGLWGVLVQIGGNILLTVPYGVALFLLCRSQKLYVLLPLLLLLPVAIEGLQWGIGQIIGLNYRSIDVDDVILNVAGCVLGYGFGMVFLPKLKGKILQKRQ